MHAWKCNSTHFKLIISWTLSSNFHNQASVPTWNVLCYLSDRGLTCASHRIKRWVGQKVIFVIYEINHILGSCLVTTPTELGRLFKFLLLLILFINTYINFGPVGFLRIIFTATLYICPSVYPHKLEKIASENRSPIFANILTKGYFWWTCAAISIFKKSGQI
jgi:hypothetical protein